VFEVMKVDEFDTDDSMKDIKFEDVIFDDDNSDTQSILY
jgi:hypothetical protein